MTSDKLFLFLGILPLIFSIIIHEIRILKIEKHVNDHCMKIDMLLYEYLKRNKKKIKSIKIGGKDVKIDEIFK